MRPPLSLARCLQTMFHSLLLSLIWAACWGTETSRRASGAVDARRDISEGKLRIMSHGIMPHFNNVWLGIREIQMLRDTYGVEARSQGCGVREGQDDFDNGYNSVV